MAKMGHERHILSQKARLGRESRIGLSREVDKVVAGSEYGCHERQICLPWKAPYTIRDGFVPWEVIIFLEKLFIP